MISRAGDFGDVNNNRAWLVNVFVKPDQPYGLRIGGSVYRDKLNPLTGARGAGVDRIGAHGVEEGDTGVHRRVRQRAAPAGLRRYRREQPGILRADRLPPAVAIKERGSLITASNTSTCRGRT